jgi:hypothetical protein
MAEQDLNGPEVHARLQQVSREGVPQRVGMNRFRNASVEGGFLACPENRLGRDWMTGLSAGEQPLLGALPAPVDIVQAAGTFPLE